jgi:hypothetical protein
MFLFKSHLIFVGIFTEHTNSLLIKLYLSHMFIAFTNFNFFWINSLRNIQNTDVIDEH